MKTIFITQRSVYNKSRNELLDCLDSKFSELWGNDFYLIPVPNNTPNPQKFAENFNCAGIILSGGNSLVEKDENYSSLRIKCEIELLNYAIKNRIPVFGICYGMQFLNAYCGGTNRECENHVETEHVLKAGSLDFMVNSYHNYAIFADCLAPPLRAFGICKDDSIEAFVHQLLPWIGIMWHPERSIYKHKIWIEMIKKIFIGTLPGTESDIMEFLKSNYDSY